MTQRLLLRGVPGSPYTRKMLALLRYRRIPYDVAVPGSPFAEGLPRPKVELQPTFYFPDAAGGLEPVTDSTPLIRRFEQQFRGRAVRPPDPAMAFVDSLLEDYADEWLTKALFHYRWHFEADVRKAGDILPRWRRLRASDEEAAELTARFSQRQIDRLRFVGSNETTAEVIEASYLRLLTLFESHLKTWPFLMGERPGASDFGFYGQLSQLVHFDPTPAAIALAHAPRVCAWVGLADDLSGADVNDGSPWIELEAMPSSLRHLLAEAGRTYVPVMLANARALRSNAGQVEAQVDGRPWIQSAFPYQGKCVAWLREEFNALSPGDQGRLNGLLEETGCLALVREPIGPAP